MIRRRLFSLLLVSAFALSLFSCKVIEPTPDASESEEQGADGYEILANRVTPDNGEMETYYLPSEPDFDALGELRLYCESGNPSAELSEVFRDADEIGTIPAWGIDLEATRLFLGVFSSDRAICGAFLMCWNEDGTLSEADLSRNDAGNPISNAACTERLTDFYRDYPGFQLQGVIYDMSGWREMYPVGAADGSYLQYYHEGSLHDFPHVKPFRTIAEGRQSIESYLKQRAQTLSELPIYPWKSQKARFYLGISGYLSRFKGETVGSMSRPPEDFAYLEDYDNLILVPLLDADGAENVFQLLLLYRHNVLIAELVLERLPTDGSIRLVRETVSPRIEQGAYTGLAECAYEREVNLLIANAPSGKTVRGVTLTKTGYRLIFN